MCVLERTHGYDPIPAIFSPIPTPAKLEPLVLLGVVRGRMESTEVVRSLQKSESFGVV